MIRQSEHSAHRVLPLRAPLRAPLSTLVVAVALSACGTGSPTTPETGSAIGSTPETNTGEPTDSNNTSNPDNSTDTDSSTDSPSDTSSGSASNDPITCGSVDLEARLTILERINGARAEGQFCGAEWYPAVGAVSWDDRLEQTAIRHSNDMASHNIFSHTGTDGSSIGERASSAGYEWNLIGENIAAGQQSAEQAILGWLESPGHCRNIMNASFTDMGLACESNQSTTFGNYWTQVFGNEP